MPSNCGTEMPICVFGNTLFQGLCHLDGPFPRRCHGLLCHAPMGLDGGTGLISELYPVVPAWIMTVFAAGAGVVLTATVYAAGVRQWQYYLFILCFPLGVLFVHLTGPRMSNWFLRVLTGGLFGLAYAWLLFPVLQDSFKDLDSKPRPVGDYAV